MGLAERGLGGLVGAQYVGLYYSLKKERFAPNRGMA